MNAEGAEALQIHLQKYNLGIFCPNAKSAEYTLITARYLSTFLSNSHCYSPLVDFVLVKDAIKTLLPIENQGHDAFMINVLKIVKQNTIISVDDSARQSYLIAAAALGALQSGEFQDGLQFQLYRKMNFMLRYCYYEERQEVVRTHMLIAFFCHITGQLFEYKKHRGFSRTILQCAAFECEITNQLEQAQFIIELGESSPALWTKDAESALLSILKTKFEISQEDFATAYPLMHSFYIKPPEKYVPSECKKALDGIMSNGPAAMIVLCLMSMHFLQKLLDCFDIDSQHTREALNELHSFLDLLTVCFGTDVDNTSLLILGFVGQIQFLCGVASGDLVTARASLLKVISSIDTYTLCMYLSLGSVMERQLHFLVTSVEVFRFGNQGISFQKKLEKACSIFHHTSKLPINLVCDTSECQSLYQTLQLRLRGLV